MTKNQFIDGMTKVGVAVIAGVLVAIFSFYMARKAYSADEVKQQINSKLDKIEFKDFKIEHTQEENAYRVLIDKRIDRQDKNVNDKLDLIIKLIDKK